MIYAEVPIAAASIVERAVSNAQAAFQTSDWAAGAPRALAGVQAVQVSMRFKSVWVHFSN
jgi:hypothetical protein